MLFVIALFVFMIPILFLLSISNILRSSNFISNCGFLAIFIHLPKLSLVSWFVFTVILVIKLLSQWAALILGGIDSQQGARTIPQRFWSISLSAAHPWCQAPIPLRPKCAVLDWDLWRLFEYIVMSKKHIWNYLNFVMWCFSDGSSHQ